MGLYIPQKKRARLLKYKYSSTDKSLTSVRDLAQSIATMKKS